MPISRRTAIGGVLAATLGSSVAWAQAGNPTHLSAARDPNGEYALYGIRGDGSLVFRVKLPGRGHAAAAHPFHAEAVAFARRPGMFALVIDCASGQVVQRLAAPSGRHFYGHGAFSRDGKYLFTTENHIDTGEGRIGVWIRETGYRRFGEWSSGGIGPHEILRIPGTPILAVANGGIRTHPDSGREKLNLASMRPNLTLISENGEHLDRAELDLEYRQNSLRHLAAAADGTVACAFQWQGDEAAAPPLLGIYRKEKGLRLLDMPPVRLRSLKGYVGSVAFVEEGLQLAITSPRGGVLQFYEPDFGFRDQARRLDVCGVAGATLGGIASDGTGGLHQIADSGLVELCRHEVAFDNHLVRISAG